jgi:hypothetical protein
MSVLSSWLEPPGRLLAAVRFVLCILAPSTRRVARCVLSRLARRATVREYSSSCFGWASPAELPLWSVAQFSRRGSRARARTPRGTAIFLLLRRADRR